MCKYMHCVVVRLFVDTEVFPLPPAGLEPPLLPYRCTINIQFLDGELSSEPICASFWCFPSHLVSHLKQ